MPKRRYERQAPTHEWSQIRPLLKDTAQIKYELIRPCGRILALNRQLYHLQMPRSADHTKKELSFQSAYRHHYWFVDIRYLDMHHLGGEMIYCISILEGYSRAILASAVTRRQNFEEYIAVL